VTDLMIVDGYNFIFNFINPKGLDNDTLAFCRGRLISDLADYHYHNKREVVVVFDARHSDNRTRTSHYYNHIRVIYSRSGETADSVIEQLVESNRKYDRIYVVTSDYMQQKVIFKGNIYRISSREFGLELDSLKQRVKQEVEKINRKSKNSFYSLEKRLSKKTIDDITKIRKN